MGRKRKAPDEEGRELDGPFASVIVCTYSAERLDLLVATIRSLQAQTHKNREIIVVTDRNPELAAALRRKRWAGTTIVKNDDPGGLSAARNAGVRRARGEIIAFIDDDATAEETWLEGLLTGYTDERVIGVGGGVVPAWEGGRQPGWLPDEFLWTVGCSYRGLPNGGEVRNPIGCNMSFRSTVFESVGGFDTLVGRVGSSATGCEETEFCVRALNKQPGARIVYLPGARVHHYVPAARQSPGYFLRRCFSEGKSKFVVRKLAGTRALRHEQRYLGTLVESVRRNLGQALQRRDTMPSLRRAVVTGIGLLTVGSGFLSAGVKSRTEAEAAPAPTSLRERRLIQFSLTLTAIAALFIMVGLVFSSLRLNEYGLVKSFPLPFYLGLALLPIASAPAWFTHGKVHALVVSQLVLLLVALSLSPYILEHTARFRTAYGNFGDVDWLLSGGGLHPSEAVYHNWPLFPALVAGFLKVTSLPPTTLLAVFPFVINLLCIVPLTLVLRQFSRGDNRWWAGVWFFYLFNWTGQDYFSPQAFAVLLFLAFLAVLVHVAVYAGGRFTPLTVAVVLGLFGMIVLTHLLTAILALTTLAVLLMTRRLRQPSLLLTAAAMFVAWQAYGAFDYFQLNHQRNLGNLLDPETFILFNVKDRLQGAPGHVMVGRIRMLTTIIAFVAASAGILAWIEDVFWVFRDTRHRWQGKLLSFQQIAGWLKHRTSLLRGRLSYSERTAAGGGTTLGQQVLALASEHQITLAVPILAGILVVGPVFVYGGEMLIRIMLFSLPALSILFVATLSWRRAAWPALGLLALIAPVHMVAYYGNELHDYVSPGEVEAFRFVETQLTPANVVGGYPAASFQGTAHLESRAAVVSGEKKLPTPGVYLSPDKYVWRHPEWPIYVAIGRGDGAAAYLFYNQKNFVEQARAAVSARCNFGLVFDNGDMAIYRWQKHCSPRNTFPPPETPPFLR